MIPTLTEAGLAMIRESAARMAAREIGPNGERVVYTSDPYGYMSRTSDAPYVYTRNGYTLTFVARDGRTTIARWEA